MKKILYSLLALAATVAACTDFAEDEKIDFAATDAPVVAATVVDDNTVSVSVTPKEGNVYYSYVLIAGPAKALKAETVLKGGYESDAVADEKKEPVAAVLKASETKSVSFQVGGLKSNTAYTLYAVASNSQGVVSKLATSTAVTTDGTVPVLKKYDFQSTATNLDYVLEFDDPIAFTGKAQLRHIIMPEIPKPEQTAISWNTRKQWFLPTASSFPAKTFTSALTLLKPFREQL